MDKLLNERVLHDRMRAAHLDAVVGLSLENVFYCSGAYIRTQASIRDRLAVCVLPLEGPPALLVCNIEESLAKHESWISDVRSYIEFAESPMALLVDVLRERGLTKSRIGLEMRCLSVAYHQELITLAPGWQFLAGDEVFDDVRSHKSRLEVEQHTHACRQTEQAIYDAWGSSHVGDSERVIQDRMTSQLLKLGASSVRSCTLAIGPNAAHAHHAAGDRQSVVGELVRTDFGGIFAGFASDIARMGVIGKAGPKLQDHYKRIRGVQRETIAYLKPGVHVKDIFNFCAERFRRAGITFDLPHVGHSLRLDGGHEEPIIHPYSHRILHEGMLLCIEPVARGPQGELCGIEDVVYVGPNGPEMLTTVNDTSELMVVGQVRGGS